MKRLFFIVSIAFILSACDDGTMNQNPFIGTWEYEVIDQNWETNGVRYFSRYTFFNDTEFTLTNENYLGDKETIKYVGVYSYDDRFFYFDCTRDEDGRKFTNVKSYYELDNDTLHIGSITFPIDSPDSQYRQYYLYPHKKIAD